MSYVTKRNGHNEPVQFDKITERISRLINPQELQNLDLPYLDTSNETSYLDPILVAQKVVANLYSGITTEELDIQSAEICVNLSTTHPSYAHLGGRILVSNLHKKTLNNFTDKMVILAKETNNINEDWLAWILENSEALNSMVNYNRDYIFDYFGFKTLEKAYLLKSKGKVIERPQDTLLRTASTLQMGNLEMIKKTYDLMSLGFYTHASPTLFNAGTNHSQLSSCFVENTEVMTMDGIKNIQDILVGDKVVTHTGQVKTVLQTHKNPLNNRTIYKLQVYKSKPVFVTDNHRFLAITKDNDTPRWISVKDMDLDTRIAIPSYRGSVKEETITLNPNGQVTVTDKLATVMGTFIGYGNVIFSDEHITGIQLEINNNIISKSVLSTLNSILGSNIFSYNHNINNNTTTMFYYSPHVGELFRYMFGDDINSKHLWRNTVSWNTILIRSFLNGLTLNGTNTRIQLANPTLANQLYHLFRLYGISVSLVDHNELEVELDYENMYVTTINDVKFLKISELVKTDMKPQYVYTIGVEDDHSYNIEGLICENCFLLGTNDDLSDIATTWNSCAQISKWAGGIGLHVSNIRGKDSLIHGTGGRSNGLVPFLRVFNDIARWIDQGGRRPGSIAIYLEPHHPDIFEFLELRKNFGSETERARDLFMSLWISDLFMNQVESDGDWYLLSPDECPGLNDTYGDAYETLYWNYVNEGKYRSKVKARKVWSAMMESQIETGMPYVCFKDAINKKCNQKNLGTIKSSNLCAEITEYSDHNEYAVCNLASIALKPFVVPFKNNPENEWIIYTKPNCKYCKYAKKYLTSNGIAYTEVGFSNDSLCDLKDILSGQKITFPQIFIRNTEKELDHIGGWSDLYKYTAGTFDYDKLYDTAYTATINLDRVIDINYYPVPQTKLSNIKHRPIGLGIQGLADALVLMRIPYDSDKAVEFNSKIMEIIYLASVTASNNIAIQRYDNMKKLITFINENKISYPDYYESTFRIENSEINELYHSLRPSKFELQRNTDLTTLGSYSSFDGSPLSEGKFQFNLWDKTDLNYNKSWDELRQSVMKYGTRNSLLTALMPTASTSQILGNNECFEFFTNNIYTRKTQAGDFILVNKYLVKDLISVGLWSHEIKDKIIAANGSIQLFEEVPPEYREIYKTIWEIKQIWVLRGALARAPFVDQTQSMNIFMAEPDYQRLSSCHFWGWKNGLKTGMYYLRTKPSADAIKFTVDPTLSKTVAKMANDTDSCENCSA